MKFVATLVLLIAAIVIGIAQYRTIKHLTAENAELRLQVKYIPAAAKSVEPTTATPLSVNPTNPRQPASLPNAEVLRLRADLAAARSELAQKTSSPPGIRILSEAEFETFHASLAREDVRQILTFDSLHDAGAESPEATVQSYLWTVRLTMDPATFATANERVKQIVHQPPGSNYGGFGAAVKDDPLRDLKIVKVEAVVYPTPDTAKVRVSYYNDLQGFQRSKDFQLVRSGDEWKIDFGLGRR